MRRLLLEAATPADLEALLAMERASHPHPWTRRNFEGELAAEGGTVLVLRDPREVEAPDRGLRGYCAFRVVADEMHLMNLTVDPAHRGQGLGRFLLDLALNLAARRGGETAWLEVRDGNAAALALYRTAGFEVAGRRPGYYTRPREDALLLRRTRSRGGAFDS